VPTHQITNPNEAFESAYGGQGVVMGFVYTLMQNTNGNTFGTVKPGQVVMFDNSTSGVWAPPTNQMMGCSTSGALALQLGVSVDTIPAGATGRIVTLGVCPGLVGTATTGITQGTLLVRDSTTAGSLTNASASPVVVGTTIAVGLVTSTTLGASVQIYVCKQ
jgi:predicted RecA/RadA family phage recombinase